MTATRIYLRLNDEEAIEVANVNLDSPEDLRRLVQTLRDIANYIEDGDWT